MTCRILVLVPLCLAIVLAAETARSGDKKEQEKLEGTWSVVEITGGKFQKKDKKHSRATRSPSRVGRDQGSDQPQSQAIQA